LAAHMTNIALVPAQMKLVIFSYFGAIGIAYLFLEIPVIQKIILYLDNPAYAITLVLFSLLLFSGLGSQMSMRYRTPHAILALILLVTIYPACLGFLFQHTLGYPTSVKLMISALVLSPVGFLMGFPFPAGVRMVSSWQSHEVLIPWAWGINGAASVISSILAALLALRLGFQTVFILSGVCYGCAWIMAMVMERRNRL